MASAAGGTSQRLKPGFATMFSREKKPGFSPLVKFKVVTQVRPPKNSGFDPPLSFSIVAAIAPIVQYETSVVR